MDRREAGRRRFDIIGTRDYYNHRLRMNLPLIISIAQLTVVVLLIGAVLLQQKGVGLGSSFGGGDSVFTTRRGPEKIIFNATIVLSTLFIGLGIASFLI